MSYGLRALFCVFQCSVTQPLVQGLLFFGGRNVGERALLYVQRHFTNKSCASNVVISQEGNSRPQPQPDSPGASQPAHHSHSGFLSEACGMQDSCKHHPYSFCLPCTAAFCTVVFRAKAKLYCLYVHLLSASVVWLRVNVFPLKQSHKTGRALCIKGLQQDQLCIW